MIQLGSTILNPNLIWADRDSFSSVSQQKARTLGGSQVLWAQDSSGGRPITLIATTDQGWYTKAMKDEVVAMGNSASSTYVLQIGVNSYTVAFAHHEAPAVSLNPLIDRAVDLVGDYFIGVIKLTTL